MVFDSFDRKLKKSYGMLNPVLKEQIFSHGENEYLYVGNILHKLFPNKDIFKLIQIYASVYSYFKMEASNSAKTYYYARGKAKNTLSDDETVTLIALIILNLSDSKASISDLMTAIEKYKAVVNNYIDTVIAISRNIERFNTQEKEVGTMQNPILVDGIKGVRRYIDNLDFKTCSKIKCAKSQTLYLTDDVTNISYSINEYIILDAETDMEFTKLWFNIYGTTNCKYTPEGINHK